jgi:glycosyltransferase involved in cell wall biosynthesis
MSKFDSASIILPVLNETYSLRQTVDIIEATCARDVGEYVVVVCDRTTPGSLEVCREVVQKLGSRASLHFQKRPFVGGAIRDGFDLARGSHVIMMSSDLETDPALVQTLIKSAKEFPDGIATASRWIEGGQFKGYSPLKLVANYIFQKTFSLLYGTQLTDLTYAYRIFPLALVRSIQWQELKHPFFLETAIKPLRLGVSIREIPAVWRVRTEGTSVNPFLANFTYFRIALRTRFSRKERILIPGQPAFQS